MKILTTANILLILSLIFTNCHTRQINITNKNLSEYELSVNSENYNIDNLENSEVNIDSVLGKNVKNYIKFKNSKEYIMTSMSQINPCYKAKINSYLFSLGVDQTSNTIIFLMTTDSNFTIYNDIKVGKKLNTIYNYKLLKIRFLSGWGYFVELNNGWKLGLKNTDYSSKLTNDEIYNLEITSIYKDDY